MGQSSASESESPVASGALLGSSIVEFSTVGAGLTRHHPVRVIRRMMLQDKAYSRSLTSSKTKIRLDRRIFMTGEETKTTP
jgi:hypothetical protein